MASQKTKAVESAVKFLSQGKLSEAVGEYQKALRADPKDQNILMTLGDLFVRQGDTRQAIECFEKLADFYLQDGFNSKAIAIYKKIAKLCPSETGPLERLAELYVQQGVLSEARPIFLQLAEIHWKAGQAQRAAETLRRLLEVEPENPRVLLRLVEMSQGLGQRTEAAKTLLAVARRLLERGDVHEVQKLADKALELDGNNMEATLLKAQALDTSAQSDAAIILLEAVPAEMAPRVSDALFELCLKAKKNSRAAEIALRDFHSDPAQHPKVYRVVCVMLDTGAAMDALNLLRELRDPMFEAGETEKLGQALASVADQLPGELQPLEWLVELYRRTGDSFRLKAAMLRAAEASFVAGQFDRAEPLYEEILKRDPENERLLARMSEIRNRQGPEARADSERRNVESVQQQPAAAAAPQEPALDEETQRFLAQSLTDVDLFASYGLTAKALELLESVLERAPTHTPALERLLDMHVGAGDAVRTVEIAGRLERIHLERGNKEVAERYTEMRRRFRRSAALGPDETVSEVAEPTLVNSGEGDSTVLFADESQIHAQESAASAAMNSTATAPAQRPEFEISPSAPSFEEDFEVSLVTEGNSAPEAEAAVPISAPASPEGAESAAASSNGEIDLSDEWEALSAELSEPAELSIAPNSPAAETAGTSSAVKSIADQGAINAEPAAFELELVAAKSNAKARQAEEAPAAMTAETFLSQLAAEVEDMTPPVTETEPSVASFVPIVTVPPSPAPESPNELGDIFQEFRSEMDTPSDEEEDLETHYNLGIAYREMGLLDESIGEFQRVAKAMESGHPFRYAMQCRTLLGLCFMAKDEPKIAALWYERALATPGLDQESILALRYDLGVAQELAGSRAAALEAFQHVYAMNIDYRDVAERIAALQKH
ncbi:MAG: tetratricopeptide repeat protein [Candidatus Acidiferrales bacterium]